MEPTIFHESWWLNAATGGDVEEVQFHINGKLVGRFPYVLEKLPLGRVVCRTPPHTHILGPAIDEGHGAACNQVLRRDSIVRELLNRLPRTTGFRHTMHSGISDMLVFQEQGYDISVQFTHTIAPGPVETIWKAMRDKTRNVIRGAQKSLAVSGMGDIKRFVETYGINIHLSGYRNVFDMPSLSRICVAAVDRGRGKILAATRSDGRVEAAIFYVWDARRAYYLVTTRNPDAHNGAVSLLIWTAIQECAQRNVTFDFDGVGTQGARLFYAGFGGTIALRFVASRYNKFQRMIGIVERNALPQARSKYLF